MAWKSTALDTYNMYMEKEAISRRSKFLAFISNWFVLVSYIILPPILIGSDDNDVALGTFNFNPTDLYGFAVGCLVVGHVTTVFLCIRHFNNLLYRLETILLPSTTAHFAGLVSCLFNFAGRKGRNVLTGNTAALLSFNIVAFVVFGVMTFYAYRTLARIQYQEKHSRVVSASFDNGKKAKSPYIINYSSTATTATSETFKKAHGRKQSSSSRKNLLNVLSASVNPAGQSTSTIATFLDNDDGDKKDGARVESSLAVDTMSKHPSKVSTMECPTSPTLRTANFAIPVRAPNPAAWKPNVTIHSSNSHSRSGSRSHSRSNSSSVYSLHQIMNELPQPILEDAASSTLGKSGHVSTSSYTTFLPPSSVPSSPSTPPPPVPSTTIQPTASPKSKEKSKSVGSKYVPNDVRYLLQEANDVLVGFSQSPPPPPSPSSKSFLSLAPSKHQSRCGSPHPKSFLALDLPIRAPSQSQSVFLGELYDCYKYDEEEYSQQFEKLDLSKVDVEKGISTKPERVTSPNREFYVFPEDVRDSIISTGSASQARRSKRQSNNSSNIPKLEFELERKGSLGSFSGGTGEGDRIKEVSLRSPVGNYDGLYI